MPDYIPAKDADLLAWSANFDTKLTAAPTDYGLVAGDATAYAALHSAFDTALAAATAPATRTTVTVATKDTARAALVASARSLAAQIHAFPTITGALLSGLGLTVPDTIPSPIPAPVTTPVLSVMSSASLQLTLRFKDSVSAAPRGKPAGAIAAEVWYKVDGTAPASVADCDYTRLATRVPFVVDLPPSAAGKVVHFLAHWINAKGQRGPQSAVLSATCPA